MFRFSLEEIYILGGPTAYSDNLEISYLLTNESRYGGKIVSLRYSYQLLVR